MRVTKQSIQLDRQVPAAAAGARDDMANWDATRRATLALI